MADWLDAGAAGFGIGSSLFKPGDTPQDVAIKAKALVAAWVKATSARAEA